MRLLELLSFTPLSAPQLAAALHAQPRTVRRVLRRLVDDGYVVCREHGRRREYEPTMRLVAMAGQIVQRSTVARIGRPYVELLHERTGATAHLVVPSYESVLCVVHAGSDAAEVHPRVRELVPAHCTAGGKALLAWRDRWRESVLGATLERFTSHTVVEADELRRVLKRVRDDGYATEDEEHQPHVRALATPVFADGEVAGALCVSGVGLDVERQLPAVMRTARELADALDDRRGPA